MQSVCPARIEEPKSESLQDEVTGTARSSVMDVEKMELGNKEPGLLSTTAGLNTSGCNAIPQESSGLDPVYNAMDWGLWKKVYHTSIPALMGLTATFGSSVYTPGYPEVMEEFNVGTTAALLPLSLYVFGLAFGPVLAAPLSELYGRRMIYFVSMPSSLLFTLGAGFAKNFATLLICRFLAGVAGSPPLAVGAGTNLDMWLPIHRGAAVSILLLAPFLGPALGPAIGGYAVEYKGWRWTQWVLLFLGAAVWLYSLAMRETYAKIIVRRHTKKLGLPLPPSVFPSGLAAINFILVVTILRPVHMLLTEPLVGFYSLYTAFCFAVLYCFFAAFPLIFRGVYGFSLGTSGLVFLGIAVGCLISVVTLLVIDKIVYRRRVLQSLAAGGKGYVDPENRLYGAMLGSLLLPVGLFWFAWSARANIHWISCVIATVFFACGNLLIFTCCVLYLTDVYGPLNGASAMAANGILRYVFGGCFPLFTLPMYHRLGIGWATSLLGFVAIGLLPLPWIFIKYGRSIRKNSAYDIIQS